MSSPFDYVKYDEQAATNQAAFKRSCEDLLFLTKTVADGRARALAITKLEEFYMWLGKAIRDEQIARNGSAPLQEERKNG